MKIAKKITAFVLAGIIIISMLVFSANAAAAITSVKIISLPQRTEMYYKTDWDYGYWDDLATDEWEFYQKDDLVSFLRNAGSGQYADRGMLDMTGLTLMVSYSDGSVKNVTYNEYYNSSGVLVSNIYFAISNELKSGENTIYVYLPSNKKAYDTYVLNISTSYQPKYLHGDVNMNGIINSADAACVLAYTVGDLNLSAEQQTLADINDDSFINSTDALLILNKSVGK